jgi:hypothetical protein
MPSVSFSPQFCGVFGLLGGDVAADQVGQLGLFEEELGEQALDGGKLLVVHGVVSFVGNVVAQAWI